MHIRATSTVARCEIRSSTITSCFYFLVFGAVGGGECDPPMISLRESKTYYPGMIFGHYFRGDIAYIDKSDMTPTVAATSSPREIFTEEMGDIPSHMQVPAINMVTGGTVCTCTVRIITRGETGCLLLWYKDYMPMGCWPLSFKVGCYKTVWRVALLVIVRLYGYCCLLSMKTADSCFASSSMNRRYEILLYTRASGRGGGGCQVIRVHFLVRTNGTR